MTISKTIKNFLYHFGLSIDFLCLLPCFVILYHKKINISSISLSYAVYVAEFAASC